MSTVAQLPAAEPVTGQRLRTKVEKVKKQLDTAVTEIRILRAFLKGRFSSAGAGFDCISRGEPDVGRADFIARVRELGYGGSAEAVYEVLADEETGRITRRVFVEHMRVHSQQSHFKEVVELAVADAAAGGRKAPEPSPTSEGAASEEAPGTLDCARLLESANLANVSADLFETLCDSEGRVTRESILRHLEGVAAASSSPASPWTSSPQPTARGPRRRSKCRAASADAAAGGRSSRDVASPALVPALAADAVVARTASRGSGRSSSWGPDSPPISPQISPKATSRRTSSKLRDLLPMRRGSHSSSRRNSKASS